MYRYDSVAHAISELRKRGFTEDFNLQENCLICNLEKYEADEFTISEVVRFEGESDPGDAAIVYGIESRNGIKGVLVNGYGYSADSMSAAIARKLSLDAH